MRIRDLGIITGILKTGRTNSITDVEDVKVGHSTLIKNDHVRSGVTAILPHSGNIFQQKVPAAIHIGNGYGKLMGYSQVMELGNIETPIILTNTLSVRAAADALITYTLDFFGNQNVKSVNPIVGETNDGFLNDIRGRHVSIENVLEAIRDAKSNTIEEGNIGAGTGTVCFGFKGGIGTSSRVVSKSSEMYTVGVMVQTNFGGVLEINGVPITQELGRNHFQSSNTQEDGSCVIVVATDAPLDARNLERLGKRAMLGLAKTGGIAANGSGDYVIAFSTARENFIDYSVPSKFYKSKALRNEQITPLFRATIEATGEAILNSLFAADSMTGKDGNEISAIPVNEVMKIMKKYNRKETNE